MLCPVCKEEMLILEFNEVEIDYCTDCRGVWLDMGELELIAEGAGELARLRMQALRKGARRCPRCRTKMRIGRFQAADCEIDFCPKDDGFWFDRGELAAVLKGGGATGTAKKLAEYFGSVFGNEEVNGQSENTV